MVFRHQNASVQNFFLLFCRNGQNFEKSKKEDQPTGVLMSKNNTVLIGFTRCFLYRSPRRIVCKEGGQCLGLAVSFAQSTKRTPWILSKIFTISWMKFTCSRLSCPLNESRSGEIGRLTSKSAIICHSFMQVCGKRCQQEIKSQNSYLHGKLIEENFVLGWIFSGF